MAEAVAGEDSEYATNVEAANGMTSHGKACYADTMAAWRGVSPEAPSSVTIRVISLTLTIGDDQFTIGYRPPPVILAPCWIKPKRQSISGAERGKEASLAP